MMIIIISKICCYYWKCK